MFCYIQHKPTGLPTFQQSPSFIKRSLEGPRRNDDRPVNFGFSFKKCCEGDVCCFCQASLSLGWSKKKPIRIVSRIFFTRPLGERLPLSAGITKLVRFGALSSHLLCHVGNDATPKGNRASKWTEAWRQLCEKLAHPWPSQSMWVNSFLLKLARAELLTSPNCWLTHIPLTL